ncbi:MAG: ribosome-associated translation inhibitor RaiA [Sedimentisphaerales bacterium]|nr:ribosome-associated translation inhibitor RaiA [Sedimentisphaerales bacterium]
MLFTITGKHVEITDAIRVHAMDKVEKFPRYYDGLSQVEVVIEGSEGGNPSVEIIARGEHSVFFVAKETGEDLYACIDLAAHKMERQLRRKKEKQRNNKHLSTSEGSELGLVTEEDRKEDVA